MLRSLMQLLRLGLIVLIVIMTTMMTTVNASGTQYALYNLPPLVMTFQTTHTKGVETAIAQASLDNDMEDNSNHMKLLSETNGKDSSLSHPLRSITQTFLKEAFGDKIVNLEAQEEQMDPLQDYKWYDMYAHWVGLDLETKLYLVKGMALEQNTNKNENENGNTRTLFSHVELRAELYGVIAFEEPSHVNSQTKPNNDQVQTMFGAWMTTIFDKSYDEYLLTLHQSDQPLLQDVSQLQVTTTTNEQGQTTDVTTTTTTTATANANDWTERTEKALLIIVILLSIVAFGWTTLLVRQKIRKWQQRQQYQLEQVKLDQNEYTDGNEDGDGDYNFSLTATAGTGGFLSSNRHRPQSISAYDRSISMDAVRHGNDVFSVLESTDRYLSKHRPDLYSNNNDGSTTTTTSFQVFGREYTIPSNPFDLLFSSSPSTTPSSDPTRNNKTTTTTMAAFSTSPQGAFSIPSSSRRSSSMPEQENIAAMRPFDEYEYDDEQQKQQQQQQRRQNTEYYHHDNNDDSHWMSTFHNTMGYRPISTIWRNITNLMSDYDNHSLHRPRSDHDGIMILPKQNFQDGGGGGGDGGDMEMQTVPFDSNHYEHGHGHEHEHNNRPMQLLPYDHDYEDDTNDYKFVFRDFPRHDGTPCLMFHQPNDPNVLTPQQREVFEIGSPTRSMDMDNDNDNNDNKERQSTPVSDADFAKMLAQQGQDAPYYNRNNTNSCSNSTFIDQATVSSISASASTSFFYDEPPLMDAESQSVTSAAKSPSFQDKLNRLIQQKYRHYEKRSIVEKHQEKRAKEKKLLLRKQLREQERRDRHKAMEQQIDDMEAAFTTSNNTASTTTSGGGDGGHSSSPTPKSRWTSGQYQSPNPYGNGVSAAQQRYSPKPASPFRRHAGYSPYRNTTTTTATTALSPYRSQPPSPRRRPSSSPNRRGNLGRSRSYNQQQQHQQESMGYRPSGAATVFATASAVPGYSPKYDYYQTHRHQNSTSSPYSQRSLSPPGGIEQVERQEQQRDWGAGSSSSSLPAPSSRQQPFKMRPRTTQPPHVVNATSSNSNDALYVDTSHFRQYSDGTMMDHSTLDKLSMPPMNNSNSTTTPSMFQEANSKSWGSTSKKYTSPNSVLDDFFGGAPRSISRKKNNSVGGGSTGTSTSTSTMTTMVPQQQQQPLMPRQQHRRVNSFEPKDVIARTSMERPLPQQRRRNNNSNNNRRRALTPTRQDVRTTLDGGIGRTLTPTRRRESNMNHAVARPLTPMSQYMDHYNSSSSSLSSTRRSHHSRSNSLTTTTTRAITGDCTPGMGTASTRFV